MQHMTSFIERRVDGIVLVSVSDDPQLASVTESGIPIVALHPLDLEQPASSLTIDYDRAAEEATLHLIGHGYNSIGILNGPTDSAGSRQHAAGFTRAILRSPGVASSGRRSATSRGDAARVAMDWLADPDRPRAPLATVRQPIPELASRAIEVLNGSQGHVHEALPHRFLGRRSCGCETSADEVAPG
jgi:LacI family transcriptional regulator